MTVTDEQTAALRTHPVGDFEEYQRIRVCLDETNGWDGYTALLAGAFFEAVDRRFAENNRTDPTPEAIEFVARVRTQFDEEGDRTDPTAAERIILHSLGTGSIAELGDETVVSSQLFLLTALILDEQLDDAGLDAFMVTARGFGDRLME